MLPSQASESYEIMDFLSEHGCSQFEKVTACRSGRRMGSKLWAVYIRLPVDDEVAIAWALELLWGLIGV